jgi:GLPGLI family protein
MISIKWEGNQNNMKKLTLITLSIFWTGQFLFGQTAHFTTSGIIEFEKTANLYAIFQKSINKDNESYLVPAFEAFKKNQPQFKKLKSTLTFADNKTLFTPAEYESEITGFWGNTVMITQNNTIFTDVTASTSIAQKKVFEASFLVKDTTRKIKWKITDETREIAGYTCRRANALVLDSVYVVAFYTDKITVSGGPESFAGLPGMILGLALPHENISWFATKVTEMTIEPKALTPPKKGKPLDNKGFHDTLIKTMKDWGEYAQKYLKAFSL